jgi:hypothetical protein
MKKPTTTMVRRTGRLYGSEAVELATIWAIGPPRGD